MSLLIKEYVHDLYNSEKEDEKDEVVTFGDVELSDEERSLLNLGPDYMVTCDLDNEDMQVEAVVAITKLRWVRRSRGTEHMTDTEINKEERDIGVDALEQEEQLSTMIENEVRDVIGSDGIGLCMGKQRATDR